MGAAWPTEACLVLAYLRSIAFFLLRRKFYFQQKGGQAPCDHAGCTPTKPVLPAAFSGCSGASHVGDGPLKEMRAWTALEPAGGVGCWVGRQLSSHVGKVLGENGFPDAPDTGVLKLSLKMAEGCTKAHQAEGIMG